MTDSKDINSSAQSIMDDLLALNKAGVNLSEPLNVLISTNNSQCVLENGPYDSAIGLMENLMEMRTAGFDMSGPVQMSVPVNTTSSVVDHGPYALHVIVSVNQQDGSALFTVEPV